MPDKEPDPFGLEARLKRWKKKHFPQPQKQVPISLVTFRSTRPEVYDAVEDLDQTLYNSLSQRLRDLGQEVTRNGMPPAEACTDFNEQAGRLLGTYQNIFDEQVALLIASKEDLWEDRERSFTRDEIQGFSKRFEVDTVRLRGESLSAFRSSVRWNAVTAPKVPAPADDSIEARAARRTKFVKPRLDELGWTSAKWADEAKGNINKNTTRDYLNGKKRTLRPSNRRSLAEALGVEVKDLPP